MGREEDVTRKQLKMQAVGKLEQLQHFPSTGSWQDRQSENQQELCWKTPPKRIHRAVSAAPQARQELL